MQLLRLHIANLAQSLSHLGSVAEHIAVDPVGDLVGIQLVVQRNTGRPPAIPSSIEMELVSEREAVT